MPIRLGPIHSDDPALKIYRNLPPRPSWFKLLLAKLLGSKKISIDSGVKVTIYHWRGKFYLSNVEYLGQGDRMDKPDCYKCKHQRTLPQNHRSRCRHPYGNALNVKGGPPGIRDGRFNWPFSYDPVWLLCCDGFEPKTEGAR